MSWSDDILAKGRSGFFRRSRVRTYLYVAAAIVVVIGGLAGGATAWDGSQSDRLLPGARVMGVDVGRMTRPDAIAAVTARLDGLTRRAFSLSVDDVTATITLADLGAGGDVADAVDEAFAAGRQVDLVRRIWRRQRNRPSGIDVAVTVSPDPQTVRLVAERLGQQVARDPSDIKVRIVDGGLVLDPAVTGRRVDVDAAEAAIDHAARELIAGRDVGVHLDTITLAPRHTADAVPVAFVARIDEQALYLYKKGQLAAQFPIASGQYGYDTPLGDYSVTEKLEYPEWINPAPKTWGKDLPAVIPPGPGNPLGTHAIGIDAPGIYMHETLGAVGARASHGCMRMQPADIQSFYDEVPIGAPVFILDGPATYVPDVDLDGASSPSPPTGAAASV